MDDPTFPATSAVDDQVPGDVAELLGGFLADDDTVEVIDLPIPEEWAELFRYAETWLADDAGAPPSMFMKLAAKSVTAWGRKTVNEDPDRARAALLDLVRTTSRILRFTPQQVF